MIMEKSMELPQKVANKIPYDPAIPLMVMYATEIRSV
jgi:hypothetical protein